ncbi:MAG TPA: hypothetical protein VH637_17200 [Streptosporangiaceae bacterium]|jgi:hypothetical protein
MSSDQAIRPRGPAGDQPSWQPTTPGGRRPPRAPRERKPVLAALAVLLIVGGAAAADYLVTQNGKTVDAIEITAPVGAGQHIPASVMQKVQVPANTSVGYVAWNQASQVARFYSAGPIPAGTLLNAKMVVSANGLAKGKDMVGLALKEGQLPNGLQQGDHVDIFDVNGGQGCPGQPGELLDHNSVVLLIEVPSANSGSSAADFVEIAVTPGHAGAVTCNASSGSIGIAVIPGSVQNGPDVQQPPAGSQSPSSGTSSGSAG